MSQGAGYVRVYFSIVDDERFVGIYDDDHHLAAWLRLLLVADAAWPSSASLPRSARPASVRALAASGLIELVGTDRYRVHGLDRERGRRSEAARLGGLASGRSRSSRTTGERPFNDRSTTVERMANGDTNGSGTESNLAESEPNPSRIRAVRFAGARARGANGKSDPLDDALLWLSERNAQPAAGTKTHTTLCQLVDREGGPAVIAAMEALGPQVEAAQYVFGARNALHPIPGAPASPNGRRPPGGHTRTAAEVEDAFR